ncbi:MAG: HAD family phosphatase [Phycisphaeraceae bacterium]|nr:HAD family phosphatase [Phycisphaeraceae bacterium]
MWDQPTTSKRSLPVDPPLMVGIDLDGTLLRADDSISPGNIEAITEAGRKGIAVVLATARPARGALAVYRRLGLSTPMVLHNGAMVMDPGPPTQMLLHRTLTGPMARCVIAVARKLDRYLAVGVEQDEKFYFDGFAATAVRGEPSLGQTDANPVGSLDPLLDRPVTKLVVLGRPEVLGKLQMILQSKASDKVGLTYSHEHMLQIVAPGTDKSRGLALVAERQGIAPDRVMVIGDAPNDLGMMRWAGLAVAMGNAWADVLAAADMTVGTNDQDGVAAAIQHFCK